MNSHEEYADEEREYPTRAEEKAAEIALDVADEERHAYECQAEFIDGSWTYCGCDECDERETRDGDDAFESGHTSEEEPW